MRALEGEDQMRNFQLISQGSGTGGLLQAVKRHPELWNQFTVRTHHPQSAHRVVDDIILRYNPFDEGDDFVEKVCSETFVVNYPSMAKLPEARNLVMGLMAVVGGEHLGRAFISRIRPGVAIPPHSDRIPPAEEAFPSKIPPAIYYDRYHIVLESRPGVVFRCGEEKIEMAGGDVWWFNNQLEHEVVNNSDGDRLSLVVDIATYQQDYVPSWPSGMPGLEAQGE